MQNETILERKVIYQRRTFRFKSGLWMEVFYHIGLKTWAAEAYSASDKGEYVQIIGSTLDIKRHIGRRRETIRYLRRAIAEKANPKLKTINKKVLPEKLSPEQIAQIQKAIRLGTAYGAGPSKLADFITKIMPT